MRCFFVSDLHGHVDRYRKLFDRIEADRPQVVLLGGDLLPFPSLQVADDEADDFVDGFLAVRFGDVRARMGAAYPQVLLLLGNDDPRSEEPSFLRHAQDDLWDYLHLRRREIEGVTFYGYSCVPPTPFRLKDWERYDVSRYTPPGSVSPEAGARSVPVDERDTRYGTIAEDLRRLVGEDDPRDAVFLFHGPPYQTNLDRAALDGQWIDHVPLDVHVGSIAVRRFIEACQPRVTLHGHVHESSRLTGSWRDRIGRTHLFSAAHDGPELALVEFDPDQPEAAVRHLL